MKKHTAIETCPVCGGDGFTEASTPYLENHRGISGVVVQHHHICATCGGDFTTAVDMRENKRNIIRFRKGIDKVPLGCEIRSMRQRANLSIERAGEIFGGGPVAFSKYENDDLIPDEAMIGLLKLAIEDGDFYKKLAAVRVRHVHFNIYTALNSSEGQAAEVPQDTWVDSQYSLTGRAPIAIFESERTWTTH